MGRMWSLELWGKKNMEDISGVDKLSGRPKVGAMKERLDRDEEIAEALTALADSQKALAEAVVHLEKGPTGRET